MKHFFSRAGVLFLAMIISFSGCKKDSDSNSNLSTTPEAKSEHDAKSGGVYKGVLIGSSGTIKVILQDGKSEVIVTIDGTTKTLASTTLGSWTSGQALNNVLFSNGAWSINLTIDADGADPYITASIPGHPDIVIIVAKETSTQLLKAYEGTFTGNGVAAPENSWNFLSNGSVVYGIHSDGSGSTENVIGIVNGNSVSGSTTGGANYTGSFSGDNVSGTWTSSTNSGNWSGKRKL